MSKAKFLIAAAAAAALVAQPAAGAELAGERELGHRSSAFAGATLRIALDRHQPQAQRPRFALGVSRVDERVDSAARVARLETPALELTLGQNGQPQLLIGGRTANETRQRLGFAAAPAVLAVAGLAAVGLVMSSGSGSDDDELNRRQCFLPERELCGR